MEEAFDVEDAEGAGGDCGGSGGLGAEMERSDSVQSAKYGEPEAGGSQLLAEHWAHGTKFNLVDN